LKISLAGQFQKLLVGDAPNPKIIPMAGMAARLKQTLFRRFFTDGDKMRRRYFSIPRECVAATEWGALRGLGDNPNKRFWILSGRRKSAKWVSVYTKTLLATAALPPRAAYKMRAWNITTQQRHRHFCLCRCFSCMDSNFFLTS
jgi:hypothetical protein